MNEYEVVHMAMQHYIDFYTTSKHKMILVTYDFQWSNNDENVQVEMRDCISLLP